MLADSECVDTLQEADFDPQHWQDRGELEPVSSGRGAAWFISSGVRSWVLRHYRRGGWAAKFLADRYIWRGESAVRAFAECRLLAILVEHQLPVPRPVAARYRRWGVFYRCDLVTQRIEATQPLSVLLAQIAQPESLWRSVGEAIARLHDFGVDHADLNAHNVLVDPQGRVSIVDFDRGCLRAPGPWKEKNLRRLQRSLLKITRRLPDDRFLTDAWYWLLAGYAELTCTSAVDFTGGPAAGSA